MTDYLDRRGVDRSRNDDKTPVNKRLTTIKGLQQEVKDLMNRDFKVIDDMYAENKELRTKLAESEEMWRNTKEKLSVAETAIRGGQNWAWYEWSTKDE